MGFGPVRKEKNMKYLYIAEKPSSMQAAKSAYEAAGCPLGQIDFIGLAGHVCGLLEPKEYPQWQKKWRDLPLPMVPDDFQVKPIKKDIVKKVRDMLKNGKYDAIIVGTDSDVEGNGIYALLEKYLHLENFKALRFFEKDLTNKGLMNSFANLTDYHTNPRDVGMTEAYWIRAKFDWLIGFNLSVAYTVKTNMNMRVGRVKAPTLKLVYDNCRAIDNFVKKSSYLPTIITADPIITATLIDEEGKDFAYPERKDAELFLKSLGDTAIVKKIEKKIEKKPPQQLYKLTDVQYEAGQKYGYSPEQVLNFIQSLYEKKVVSYPRTEGKYVSSEKAKEFPVLLKAVAAVPGLSEVVENITPADIRKASSSKRFVNDAEVNKTSHDALIPTGKKPDYTEMSKGEKDICTMIYKRFLAIFLPDFIEEKRKYYLDVDGNPFICKGSTVINKGFTAIFDTKPKENLLPDVKEGQKLDIDKKDVHEVVSKPPARFTQGTLLKEMENIQKYMPESEFKTIMKEVEGIGMPSSRAKIISDLLSTGYMMEKGKGLYMTPMGISYIQYLDGQSITDPVLSAQWELHMKHVREGSESFDKVQEQILDYVKGAVKETMNHEFKQFEDPGKKNTETELMCPVCGHPLRKMNWGYGCSEYQNGCKFAIGKICGKMLTESQVKKLLNKGEIGPLTGFTKKDGSKFEATLVLEEEKTADGSFYKVGFKRFASKEAEMPDLYARCPKCGGKIIKGPYGWVCEKGCKPIVSYEICHRRMEQDMAEALFTAGQTPVLEGFFSDKKQRYFQAGLKIDGDKVSFYFPPRN